MCLPARYKVCMYEYTTTYFVWEISCSAELPELDKNEKSYNLFINNLYVYKYIYIYIYIYIHTYIYIGLLYTLQKLNVQYVRLFLT